MSTKILNRIIAAGVFLVSAVQFFLTAQPSVSFWDPGELSAAAALLQVPHPPGGPLFSLVGRVFHILPIPGDQGFHMNAVSALASAVTVFFLYLIAVRVIGIYKGKSPETPREAWGTYLSAAVGALALSFCDTFWFNGVEANYFAASTLLYSAMLWLMLVWYEKADEPDSSRYLLLVSYLVGLSAGVHLMSIPSFFVIMMVAVMRKVVTDNAEFRRTAYIFLGHVALLLVVTIGMWSSLTSQTIPSPEEFHAYDQKFILIMAGLSAAVMLLFRKRIFQRNSFYIPVLVGGAVLGAAYPGIIKKLPTLIHTLAQNDSGTGVTLLLIVVAAIGVVAWHARRTGKVLLHLGAMAVLFVVLGFSTYTMIVVRANAHTPMNENEPKDFSGLLSYLNREQYGDFPIFERRWTPEEDRRKTWTEYSSDLDFFWRYQMNHMFNRYVLFNFAGRELRDQDADWSAAQLFGIPFLVGLFGLYWHFRKDWKMASAFLILFIIMGYLITFYQNQQEPQPRERDYFYGGAYFVFALWIALGVRGLLDLAAERFPRPAAAWAGILALAFVFIPGRMAQSNYHTHDRSKNWVPWDCAYNILQSCEKDAVLFTNGDNDTFPLWFLQDVEGVRRDIRVVCLSLANTNWYIDQLKNREPYGALKVPISMSDREIADIQPVAWEPRMLSLPVSRDDYARFGITDTAQTNRGRVEWRMNNTLQFGRTKAVRVQDILVLDIIQTSRWKRPIYFAVSCSPDSRIGLDEYSKFCGLTWKIVPAKPVRMEESIDVHVLEASIFNEPADFSRTPQYGYKFRCTADSGVYFDENETRMLSTLRPSFRALAGYESEVAHDAPKAVAVLDRMEKVLRWSQVPGRIEEKMDFAFLYHRLGQNASFNRLGDDIEQDFQNAKTAKGATSPYIYGGMLQLYELRKEYRKAVDILGELSQMYPNDPSIKSRLEMFQARLKAEESGAATK